MRPTHYVMLVLICLNAAAGLWIASGVAGDMGVSPAVGGDEEIEGLQGTAKKDTNASAGGASFLVGLTIGMTELYKSVIGLVFAGPVMFKNLGVPSFIVDAVFAPLYLFVIVDVIYMFTGREL